MIAVAGFTTALLAAVRRPAAEDQVVDPQVHAFYYGWYANAETDGRVAHWNHEVLGVDEPASYPGGEDIGADYYPQLGTYSSHDPAVVRTHLQQCAAAGIGVLVVSWWGAGSFEDQGVPRLLDTAAELGVAIAFHLEPFPGRGAETSRGAIAYLLERYGAHPALYRAEEFERRPLVYIYDSYLTPASEWRRLLHPEGDLSIRGTELDVVAIGLWVNQDEARFFLDGGFDGFYTYFASDGFTWGSTAANWPTLAAWARDADLLFAPCVGPGYIDTRIRPWNGATTRSRDAGAYYDRMFQAALAVDPPLIGITSFNEWHEGTQIEPAVPKTIPGFTYEDYRPLAPDAYLQRTRSWVQAYARGRRD